MLPGLNRQRATARVGTIPILGALPAPYSAAVTLGLFGWVVQLA
jgi:hypothetical protein